MTLTPLQSLILFVSLWGFGVLTGWLASIFNTRTMEFCCKAGKHWFAIDRPCPLCIGEMVNEYNEAHKHD